ncbi:MAG: zinc-binding dehydrogenase [bacterium]|nr:zinc-binding dehydrogenase [bacterium]
MKIKTMKAAILVEQRKPLIIDEVELPDSLDYGQVLVRVDYSGICGSQLGEINGAKGEDKFLPHLLGHEGAGEVIECGPGVKHVKEGDSVVLHWRKGQGIDAAPPTYKWQGNTLNAGFVTTFNEYAVVSENRLTTIPKSFPKDVAALFGCAITTGFGVVTNNAKLKIGQSVLIYGAGGVGLNIVQAASLSTAYPIIAIDRVDAKLELAKTLGATHTINSTKENVTEAVTRIVGDQGVDAALDNTGNPDVVAECYKLTKATGKTILVGVIPKGKEISIYPLPLHFGKELSGSHGGECNPSIDIPNFIRLCENNIINFEALITDTIPLEQINTAITNMVDGKITGRCIIPIGKAAKTS